MSAGPQPQTRKSDVDRETDRLARALLSRITEPGDLALAQLLSRYSASEIVEDLRTGRLTTKAATHWRARLPHAHPEADLAAIVRLGGRFLVPGDDEWPEVLDDLVHIGGGYAAPPLGLWVWGQPHLADLARRGVAVVGSRDATPYGVYVATELARELAERGWCVVSGAAYGIDGAAHRGALVGGGPTVAVLAGGVDVPYPRGHVSLLARIRESGLIVSEWPPGSAPMRYRFLVRNRVIAALTRGTVVVEAAARSGSLNTANRARELGRHVMAVPGPVTSALSAGSNALLREPDVVCVTGAAEVLELVGPLGTSAESEQVGPMRPRDQLDPLAARVLDAVPVRRAAGPASIAVAAGLAVSDVLRALGTLAAGGFVERIDDGWRVVR
ncbi:MAG: DNA-protecting protein DprA [Acidothermus sp.]|nr:DNA-protecting protein DprA [Acidothermus sp.]